MVNISANLVKELREETNVGMMECKRALEEACGDKVKAIQILRERGIAVAQKKASRAANQGIIASAITADGKAGSLIEVNCETDFVAKNESFRTFVMKLAKDAAQSDIDLIIASKDAVTAKIAEIGENILLKRFIRYVASPAGIVFSYIHHNGTIGVLLEIEAAKKETSEKDEFKNFAKDICLHITASHPKAVERTGIPAELVKQEREIYAKQVTNKPANIVEKIVDGKMSKFYSQVCLLEQPFVKDQDRTVQQVLQELNQKLGDAITIKRFARFQVGETVN
jgi:elongation factor Ts